MILQPKNWLFRLNGPTFLFYYKELYYNPYFECFPGYGVWVGANNQKYSNGNDSLMTITIWWLEQSHAHAPEANVKPLF